MLFLFCVFCITSGSCVEGAHRKFVEVRRMNEVYVILILCVLYYQRQLCGGSAQKIC